MKNKFLKIWQILIFLTVGLFFSLLMTLEDKHTKKKERM